MAVRLLIGKIVHNIRQFQRAILDNCKCTLTEQNIAINYHNDAMILYIGHYRPKINILKAKSNFTLLLYIPFLGIGEWYFKCV